MTRNLRQRFSRCWIAGAPAKPLAPFILAAAFLGMTALPPLVIGQAQSEASSPHGPTQEFLEMRASLEDPAQGWKRLFNGKDLSGWRALQLPGRPRRENDWKFPRLVILDPADVARLKDLPYPAGPSGDDGRIAPAFVNNERGRSPSLITVEDFRDIELYVEFMVPRRSNSGVCPMGLYEIQISDSYGKTDLKYGDNGGIYARPVGDKRVGGRPPSVNASRPPGQWQSFQIWFRAPRFDAQGNKIENARFLRVKHNGTLIHGPYELEGSTRGTSPWEERPTGPLLLQGDHGPVAFRNIYIRPLRSPF